jgi:hypothetical protein
MQWAGQVLMRAHWADLLGNTTPTAAHRTLEICLLIAVLLPLALNMQVGTVLHEGVHILRFRLRLSEEPIASMQHAHHLSSERCSRT